MQIFHEASPWLLEGGTAYIKRSLDAIENSVTLRDHREFFKMWTLKSEDVHDQLVGGRGGTNLWPLALSSLITSKFRCYMPCKDG